MLELRKYRPSSREPEKGGYRGTGYADKHCNYLYFIYLYILYISYFYIYIIIYFNLLHQGCVPICPAFERALPGFFPPPFCWISAGGRGRWFLA
jgi:hypothetical protein